MTDQESSFLRAIIAEPYTPGAVVAPAMMYADWLEEHGHGYAASVWRGDLTPPNFRHRTEALRLLTFNYDDVRPNVCWLVHSIGRATPISRHLIDGWCEQLTKATGVPFTKQRRSSHADDFVLSPARNVYVCMGEQPTNSELIV